MYGDVADCRRGNYGASLNISRRVHELAELSELSQTQFVRLFRRLTGLPPHRWHLCARIRRAQVLLVDSNLPMIEIALIVGFADQSHFINVFRRQVGVSPGSWRGAQPQGMVALTASRADETQRYS
jgi:transcriptional regulator GlxA family with amidase domain